VPLVFRVSVARTSGGGGANTREPPPRLPGLTNGDYLGCVVRAAEEVLMVGSLGEM